MRQHVYLLALVLCACAHLDPEPVDPGPPPPDRDGSCAEACANLKRLQCPGWQGSPGPDDEFGTEDDVACEPACEDVVTADPSVTLHQGCVAAAESCEEADRCFENPG